MTDRRVHLAGQDPEVQRIVRHLTINRTLGNTDQDCWCGPHTDPEGTLIHELDAEPPILRGNVVVSTRRRRDFLRRLVRPLGVN